VIGFHPIYKLFLIYSCDILSLSIIFHSTSKDLLSSNIALLISLISKSPFSLGSMFRVSAISSFVFFEKLSKGFQNINTRERATIAGIFRLAHFLKLSLLMLIFNSLYIKFN
jgi:hypothetical protein